MFPSPCGERVLLNIKNLASRNSNLDRLMFPSPCGERVLLNGRDYVSQGQQIVAFPSPCGERVLLNIKTVLDIVKPRLLFSFRPLAGKGFC